MVEQGGLGNGSPPARSRGKAAVRVSLSHLARSIQLCVEAWCSASRGSVCVTNRPTCLLLQVKWCSYRIMAIRIPNEFIEISIAASSLTALDALCDQPKFWPAWCHEHSAATATEPSQPLDLACGTLSLPVQLCNLDITHGLFRRQQKRHLIREAWTQRSVTSDM